MPTNGIADSILYSINGAPVFTYGMITITACVLAYVTFIETPDIPTENPLEVEKNETVESPSPINEPSLDTLTESSRPEMFSFDKPPIEETKETIPQEEEVVPTPEIANEINEPTEEITKKQGGKKKQSRKNKSNISKISKRKTRTTHK